MAKKKKVVELDSNHSEVQDEGTEVFQSEGAVENSMGTEEELLVSESGSDETLEVDAEVDAEEALAEDSENEEPLPDSEPVLEAILFACGEPMAVRRFSEITKLSKEVVVQSLEALTERYTAEGSGLELRKVAGKYQIRTRAEYASYIQALKAGKPRRLTHAALETLAIIAYRQPIVKSDVEKIRGVDATPTIKTLLERKLIKIVGHKAAVGQPALYGSTEKFLQLFGLESLSELPSLRDLRELDQDPGEVEEHESEEGQALSELERAEEVEIGSEENLTADEPSAEDDKEKNPENVDVNEALIEEPAIVANA